MAGAVGADQLRGGHSLPVRVLTGALFAWLRRSLCAVPRAARITPGPRRGAAPAAEPEFKVAVGKLCAVQVQGGTTLVRKAKYKRFRG